MSVSFKALKDQVVVITGASSGIGLATAKSAAKQGARVVLAARNGQALADIERQLTAEGGRATHVVADVSRREDVQRLADTTLQTYGTFDTWVNNAGVGLWGRLEEVSDEDHRRLFDTNFWGIVYGSLVAVKHLKKGGGALVNLGSEVSDVAVPIQGMYATTKHAVCGFTDSLRMELEEQRAPVSVTLVRPAAIDTPFPQHARNYFDKEPVLPAPVYKPEDVAGAILHAATHSERDIYVGGGGRLMSGLARHAPRFMDWLGARVMSKQQLRDEPARNPAGSLHRPGTDGDVRGDHPGFVHPVSLYTQAVRHPAAAGMLAVGAGVAVAALLRAGASNGRRGS